MAADDLDGATLAAWRAFLTAHALIVRRIEAQLAEADLPPLGWYDVLWALREAPARRLRMNALADEVVILSRTGLIRLVDRIEAAGLLRREAVPGDRRGAYAVITDEGVAMLRRMWPVYRAAIAAHFAPHAGSPERLRGTFGRMAESAKLSGAASPGA